MDDEADIMRAVQGGDDDRFEQLVHRYQAPLFRAALSRLGDNDWAEEVVQEAFTAAYVSRQSYNPQFSFRTWIWTIVLNLCKKHYGRKQKRPTNVSWPASTGESEQIEPVTFHGGLHCVLQSERSQQIAIMLDELPSEQADAIRLRFYGDLTFREIADAMGCCVNTAKSRVRYGLERLTEEVSRRGDNT